MGHGVASTVKFKPTTINESGKKLPIQFAELNDTSIFNLLNLVWPQPMRLELSWKIYKLIVVKED